MVICNKSFFCSMSKWQHSYFSSHSVVDHEGVLGLQERFFSHYLKFSPTNSRKLKLCENCAQVKVRDSNSISVMTSHDTWNFFFKSQCLEPSYFIFLKWKYISYSNIHGYREKSWKYVLEKPKRFKNSKVNRKSSTFFFKLFSSFFLFF